MISLNQIEQLRHQTLNLIEQVANTAQQFELPAIPDALGEFKTKLHTNQYQVLVVGEAKRGKSSFINALIGRPILPTDVDIATSQVFLVKHAEHENYYLRFEDDSISEITRNDLPRYGSQVLIDVEGMPRLDQIIRWIEINVPVRFLPNGLSLLDTPGLGSLYAAHSQITQRFLPHADAVIYTLDSTQPIGQADLETLKAILEITPHIFFIQTRIDQFRKSQWQEIQARNEKILREALGNRLNDIHIWPISSINLMKAAETGDDDYLVVSRHSELMNALDTFLFKVAGWSRVASVIMLLSHYHEKAKQVLLTRFADLNQQSKEQRAAFREKITHSQQQFENEWGEEGVKRQELLNGIQKATMGGKIEFRQTLEHGGQIDRIISKKIEQLTSVEEIQKFAQSLAEEVNHLAIKKWQEINQNIRKHGEEQLKPFIAAIDNLSQCVTDRGTSFTSEEYTFENQDDWFEKMRGFRNDFTVVATLSSFVTGIIYIAFPPLAAVVGIAAGLWSLLQGSKGWIRVQEIQIKRAQAELCKHLETVREQVRHYYFDVNTSANRFGGLVDEHFDHQLKYVKNQLQRIAQQKLAELKAEQMCLIKQSQLNEQQCEARKKELHLQLTEWKKLHQNMYEIVQELKRLDQSLTTMNREK